MTDVKKNYAFLTEIVSVNVINMAVGLFEIELPGNCNVIKIIMNR